MFESAYIFLLKARRTVQRKCHKLRSRYIKWQRSRYYITVVTKTDGVWTLSDVRDITENLKVPVFIPKHDLNKLFIHGKYNRKVLVLTLGTYDFTEKVIRGLDSPELPESIRTEQTFSFKVDKYGLQEGLVRVTIVGTSKEICERLNDPSWLY
jgi:hypothetical protein